MERLNVISFFSGIGGFDLGFEKAGFEVVLQCENNQFCRSVLGHHWPNVRFEPDITNIDATALPDADVWCAGFPCQDLSVARGSNGRHGLNGKRSGLFFHLAELARIHKPQIILLENVHGLLNANMGKDFTEVLFVLDTLGYSVAWRLLNSRYFGVPQSRPRVYICASKDNTISVGDILFESAPPLHAANDRDGFLKTSQQEGHYPVPPKLAFCLAATSGRHTGTDWSRTYIPYKNEVRRLTPLECERLQGFPDDWTKIDAINIDIEKADSLRYHALGNAVTVDVVKWVAERIARQFEALKKDSRKGAASDDFIIQSLRGWPYLKGSKMMVGSLEKVRNSDNKTAWPNAGLLWNGNFIGCNIPMSNSDSIPSDLLEIIEKSKPDVRYFLSPNAAEGILRRVASQNRKLFPPLQDALERLSGKIAIKSTLRDPPKLLTSTFPEL